MLLQEDIMFLQDDVLPFYRMVYYQFYRMVYYQFYRMAYCLISSECLLNHLYKILLLGCVTHCIALFSLQINILHVNCLRIVRLLV